MRRNGKLKPATDFKNPCEGEDAPSVSPDCSAKRDSRGPNFSSRSLMSDSSLSRWGDGEVLANAAAQRLATLRASSTDSISQ